MARTAAVDSNWQVKCVAAAGGVMMRTRGLAMPKFVIEREIPGAGSMTEEQLQVAAIKSVEVLKELGPGIQWLHSYFTDNKVYCVYLATDENIIREHARKSGFPANRISRVRQLLDPSAAEGAA
jgi:hypothetical protein